MFALGMLFLTFGSSFLTAHQTIAFLLMSTVIGHENKKEELEVLANRATDLGARKNAWFLKPWQSKLKQKWKSIFNELNHNLMNFES